MRPLLVFQRRHCKEMAQRKLVLIEIEAPDEGTPSKGGGTLLPVEKWIWQDILDKGQSAAKVISVKIVEPGGLTDGIPNYDAWQLWRNQGS